MLADFLTLWNHREKPRTFKRWLVVWIKRSIHFGAMLRLLIGPIRLRHKGAKIGKLVILGKSQIEGCLVNLSIGNETSLGRCHIALHDRVQIGKKVVINDGAMLLSGTHSLTDPAWRHKTKPIQIGDYAWIATNAIILPGVSIGHGAVIGAGAVVRSDVPDYAVVIGNPAQITEIKRTTELTYSPVLLNAPFEAWVGHNLHNIDL